MAEINAYKNLAGTPEGKIPIGRPALKLEDDIKWT
jgi:hypothetical protein